MARPSLAALAAASASLLVAGCAAASKVTYTPDELRRTVTAEAPDFPRSELVVPYELPPPMVEAARRVVAGALTDDERVDRLLKAYFGNDPRSMRFGPVRTTTGAETWASGGGNCLGLASAFVGMARAVGLDARYVDASGRFHKTRVGEDGITVNEGHVSAVVLIANHRIWLDFAGSPPAPWHQPIDDLEALAHFYNNRGFELVDEAQDAGAPPDWSGAARLFRLAVTVKPTFARGWNNLGIAAARQGRRDEAAALYRRAAEIDPSMPAPRANLGVLLLAEGDVAGAQAALEAAARLEPGAAHIQYQLAVARLRGGDREGAIRALRRSLELRQGLAAARVLLDELSPGSPGAGGF